MSGSDPIVQASGLTRSFGKVQALRGLDLSVMPGEIYGLVGPDGAGKTTAIRILAGLMSPSGGEARVAGHDPMHDRGALRELLGYMPQQYSLYGDLTIDENLSFFADMFHLSRKEFQERSERLLGITRLQRFRNRRADALSGGMYKKLALACSLLHRPRLLLLDEPTNGVDPVSRREFWELLGEFTHEGMAVLISTPYMDEAARCHRVGLVHHGRTLKQGFPHALVREFPHRVFRVVGGDRDALGGALPSQPGVLALSPSGARMRVVVEAGAVQSLEHYVAQAGAELLPASPDFEDLFLTLIRQEAA
jgi:ABC-2 type transport system ATP-binding protein